MTDLKTQLRHYGQQIQSDPILTEAPVVPVASPTLQPGVRRGLAWALGAALAVLVLGAVPFLARDRWPDSGPIAPPQNQLLGSWALTHDDGSLEVSSDGAVVVWVLNDIASICPGDSATMTGSGHFESDTFLVIPTPLHTCVGGAGPRVHETLFDMTLAYDPASDTLTDSFGSVWVREPSDAEVTGLLNNFLEARIAGEGAEQYLNVLAEDIPLLYATTRGVPYERAEFEQVLGRWPYDLTGFKIRLSAGDTVVEQLVFIPRKGDLEIEYFWHGFATDIVPTAENGQPLPLPYDVFDGEVTVHIGHPWLVAREGEMPELSRLIPKGASPTTDGGQRNDWTYFTLLADPGPPGRSCEAGLAPSDAEALADSILSDPGIEATTPVAVSTRAGQALVMDVALTRVGLCNAWVRDLFRGGLTRLYLLDAPQTSSMQVLALAVVATDSDFERAVAAAAPVAESIEFSGR